MLLQCVLLPSLTYWVRVRTQGITIWCTILGNNTAWYESYLRVSDWDSFSNCCYQLKLIAPSRGNQLEKSSGIKVYFLPLSRSCPSKQMTWHFELFPTLSLLIGLLHVHLSAFSGIKSSFRSHVPENWSFLIRKNATRPNYESYVLKHINQVRIFEIL